MAKNYIQKIGVDLPNGEIVTVYRIANSVNGAPRYVTHFLSVPEPSHIEQIDRIEHARHVLKGNRYRAKWFGGGIVFTTSETVQHYVIRMLGA